ncbi:MAG: hypothetical protein PHT54_03655 [Candidatus Nanoarchaeia archaeon]|nr:hypothetical protein [Candidatus Nanoarchaeia archaeon]
MTKKDKKGIPLSYDGLVVSLMVAIIVTFQQIAVLILDYFFNLGGLSEPLAKICAYIFSLIIIIYFINKTITNYTIKNKYKN